MGENKNILLFTCIKKHLYNTQEANKKGKTGTSLVVQWVRFHAPNAGGPGSIPGQGTRSHMCAATTKDPTCHNEDPACHN